MFIQRLFILATLLYYPQEVHSAAPFQAPLKVVKISSDFGYRDDPISKQLEFHSGVDLAAPSGAPIHAISQGQIVFAGRYRGYGNLIVVRHTGGITSHYAHCKRIAVHIGDLVSEGTIIGIVGATGRVTGPHLHFEVRIKGTAVRPPLV